MAVAYPFGGDVGKLEFPEDNRAALRMPGMLRVRLPYGEEAWLVTRYAEARFVLADPRFSRAMAMERDEPRVYPGQVAHSLPAMDPPQHTRLRTLAAKALTTRRVEAFRSRTRQIAADLAEAMVAKGPPADLMGSFAVPLAIVAFCELFGVAVEDHGKFRVWTSNMLSTSRLTPEEHAANFQEMVGYVRELIEVRRAEPAADLVTALIESRDHQDRFSEDELVNMCVDLFVAGQETTSSQIANLVLTLLDHPESMAQLRADPELIPNAVEELMRFAPMVSGGAFARYATEDIQVGAVTVQAGEPVIVALDAANRDPEHFDDADTLRLDREHVHHVGYGHGLHHCIGAAFARMTQQEALRVLLAGFPELRLAGEVEWKTATVLRGPVTAPVEW